MMAMLMTIQFCTHYQPPGRTFPAPFARSPRPWLANNGCWCGSTIISLDADSTRNGKRGSPGGVGFGLGRRVNWFTERASDWDRISGQGLAFFSSEMRTAKKCLNNTLSITDSSLVREQISMLASNSDIISLTTSFKSICFNSCYVRTPNRKVPPRHRNDMTQPPPGTSCQLVYLVKSLLLLFIATHPPPKQLQVYTGNFRFVACCFRFNWKTCPFGAYLAGSRAVPSRSPGSSVNIAKPCLMFWSRNPGQIRHMGANIRSMSIEHTHRVEIDIEGRFLQKWN